jgi:hypothetical protein
MRAHFKIRAFDYYILHAISIIGFNYKFIFHGLNYNSDSNGMQIISGVCDALKGQNNIAHPNVFRRGG